jgi:hypothetical protein
MNGPVYWTDDSDTHIMRAAVENVALGTKIGFELNPTLVPLERSWRNNWFRHASNPDPCSLDASEEPLVRSLDAVFANDLFAFPFAVTSTSGATPRTRISRRMTGDIFPFSWYRLSSSQRFKELLVPSPFGDLGSGETLVDESVRKAMELSDVSFVNRDGSPAEPFVAALRQQSQAFVGAPVRIEVDKLNVYSKGVSSDRMSIRPALIWWRPLSTF